MNLYHVTKFSPYFSLTLYCFYAKISSFMPVLTIGIVLDSFYLLVSYSEKFSAWVWSLPFAVNVNLKPQGKNKIPSSCTTKPKTSRQNQRPHGKIKYYTAAKTKFLMAKANTHAKTKAILLLLWSIWFCLEVFGFAVTLAGHHRVSKIALKKWNTNLCWNIPSGKTRLPFQMFHCSGCSRNFKLERRTKFWSCSIYLPTGFSGIFL